MRKFGNILVVCDEDSADSRVLDGVSALAARHGALVTLLHVDETPAGDLARLFGSVVGRSGADLAEDVIATHRGRLEHHAAPLRARGIAVAVDVAAGEAGPWCLRGQHMLLLRDCPCPVWVFNGRGGAEALDPDSADARHHYATRSVLSLAADMAEWFGARLDVLLGEFPELGGRVRVLHLNGMAAGIIVEHIGAEEVDLIVTGAGRADSSTTATALNRIACSVLTVKPNGAGTPPLLQEGST